MALRVRGDLETTKGNGVSRRLARLGSGRHDFNSLDRKRGGEASAARRARDKKTLESFRAGGIVPAKNRWTKQALMPFRDYPGAMYPGLKVVTLA